VAPVPAHRPQSGGTGMARVLHVGRRVVTLADWLAGVIFVALNAYAVLGGADFGGGVWDLLALGPRRERQRELVAEAIGPVWEANHVWLILAIVLLFTCFPPAFARVGTLLHIPLSLVLIGIVLRGSAFTFWRYGPDEQHRLWGGVISGGGAGAAALARRRAPRARRAHLRRLGGAAASPHRGGGSQRARRPLGASLGRGARGRRGAGVAHPLGLGAEPVSLHRAARPFDRRRGRASGDAPSPAGCSGGGRGGVAAVAV